MNSHLNFNSTNNSINNPNSKLNGHTFAQSHIEPQQQPNLNRTKSSKLLDTISSAANTLFKPKIHKEQSSNQLFNETGLSKNVRLINSHDHGYSDEGSGLNLNQQYNNNIDNNYNNSMDITSPPSSSNGINMHNNSAFQNYSKMNNNNFNGNLKRLFFYLSSKPFLPWRYFKKWWVKKFAAFYLIGLDFIFKQNLQEYFLKFWNEFFFNNWKHYVHSSAFQRCIYDPAITMG